MKVGILTFHRALNYGAVLQCYALQEVLKAMGHEVDVIDYRQQYIENYYKPHFSNILKSLCGFELVQTLRYIIRFLRSVFRNRQFSKFRKQYLHCSVPCKRDTLPQNYDIYVVGSDQVWSIDCCDGVDSIYWGNFERKVGSKLYGYAISLNGDCMKMISSEDMTKYINNFDDITFREYLKAEEIFKYTGVKKGVSLDPTLLADESIWENLIDEKWENEKYIAVYQVRNVTNNPSLLIEKAKVFAKKNGLSLIDLSSQKYSVADFVSIIKYAKCVFTSSYHATVFSVIFNTPFYSFLLSDGRDGRYVELLNSLNLKSHIIDINSDVFDKLEINNYDDVLACLDTMRKPSLTYLQNL